MNRLWTTFRYTFVSFWGQILGWGLGIAALGLLIVSFYGIFMGRQEEFMQMVEGYPPEFLAFFGGDAAALLTPEGYLHMYGFSMLPVIVGIFAVIAGSGLIVSDEERGRLDLILSYPVGRAAFFFGRLLAFVAATLAILFIAWLGFCLPLLWSDMPITWGQMALPFLPLLAQLLIYGTLALLLAMLLPSRNLAATVAGLVMVVSYFLTSMAGFAEGLTTITKLLPYAYFQGTAAIHDLNLTWLFGLLAISVLMAGLAGWRFLRRDIRLSGEGSLRQFSLLRLRGRAA
jgi:ABC-2 type transport system permease protein